MIKEIFSKEEIEEYLSLLEKCHYSRKVKSNFKAYSNTYNFCKFFMIKDETLCGLICIFNSTMTVAVIKGETLNEKILEELSVFANLYSPFTLEISPNYSPHLIELINRSGDNYLLKDRASFQFVHKNQKKGLTIQKNPKLESVYAILKESFPEIARAYPIWLTDTSHKVRRNLSSVYLLENVSTATVQYIEDNVALVGHVATLPEYRGKTYARSLLYSLGDALAREGITAVLFARSHRMSYYKEIGFVKIAEDFVIERKN